jgi:hypothetical protein
MLDIAIRLVHIYYTVYDVSVGLCTASDWLLGYYNGAANTAQDTRLRK